MKPEPAGLNIKGLIHHRSGIQVVFSAYFVID